VNQWWKSRKARTGSNLVDRGRSVARDHSPSMERGWSTPAPTIGLDLFPCANRDAVRQRMTEVSAWCGEAGWVTAAVAGAVNAVEAALGTVPGSTAYP